MENNNNYQELINFFKALADANRLKIVGVLAKEDQSVEQIAVMLKLSPSTVSHHLSRLAQAGLVSARPEGYYSVYHLETRYLEKTAQKLLSQETMPAIRADIDMDAYDRKVLDNYLAPDGSINDFPAQQKKLEAILRYVVQAFEPGKRYSEKKVNEILRRYNEDTARLRRNLVDFRFMDRQGGGGEYWRL